MKYYGQLPTNIADQLILGPEMTEGLTKDEQALGIKQITAVQMKADSDALIAADKAFNVSRSAQEKAYINFHAADDALTTWLGKVTGTLAAFFGKRWNRQWVQVGFISPSISMPSTISDRLALALREIDFFTGNPNYEAPNQGVTAAEGKTLRDAALATQSLATGSDADLANKGAGRTGASAALISSMRLLVGVLSELLNPDDTRWLDFGLALPAASTTPGQPVNVTAHMDGNGNVVVQCDATPQATRYRARKMIVGVETTYTLAASSTAPIMTIGDVQPGQTVQLIVQAVNGNLQGVASDPIQFTVLLPAAAKVESQTITPAATASPIEEAIVLAARNATNGNGNGAGHSNGHRAVARV